MTGGMHDVLQEQVSNIQMTVEISQTQFMPPRSDSADHREKIVEVHQLQCSYQVVDVQLSRNDECR